MKTIKYKAWCVVEITDDLKQIPTLHKSKRRAIEDSTTYHGHACDDPLKRGVLAECEVAIKVPEMPPITDELREYVALFCGTPSLLVIGDDEWNNYAIKSAQSEQSLALKKLGVL